MLRRVAGGLLLPDGRETPGAVSALRRFRKGTTVKTFKRPNQIRCGEADGPFWRYARGYVIATSGAWRSKRPKAVKGKAAVKAARRARVMARRRAVLVEA